MKLILSAEKKQMRQDMLENIAKALSKKTGRDWKELFLKAKTDALFFSPASDEQIINAEKTLKRALPPELRSFFKFSNGLGLSKKDNYHLVKNLGEIVKENYEFWNTPNYKEAYMPLDCLFFFGSPGVDGIQFTVPITKNDTFSSFVYSWNPYDDSRKWVAPDLATFFNWWFSGKIKV